MKNLFVCKTTNMTERMHFVCIYRKLVFSLLYKFAFVAELIDNKNISIEISVANSNIVAALIKLLFHKCSIFRHIHAYVSGM